MRLVVDLVIEMRGLERLQASFSSIGEACDNAHLDLDGHVIEETGTMTFQGMRLVNMIQSFEDGRCVMTLQPAAGLVIFIGWLMTALPSRASVIWMEGWPFVKCPPNDDCDYEDDPTPSAPEELELA